jgi:hypothetical protein
MSAPRTPTPARVVTFASPIEGATEGALAPRAASHPPASSLSSTGSSRPPPPAPSAMASSRPPSSSRPPPSRPAGTFSARRLTVDVFETTFEGYLTPHLLARSDRAYWDLAGRNAIPYAILDGTGVTGSDPAIAERAGPAMRFFIERGGREYLMVTSSGILRMIGSALAATHRVTARFFETRADALAYLRSIGRW